MELDIKLIQTEWIPMNLIDPNKGQIPGVKANPRRIKKERFDDLVKSIEEDPEMLALNPVWVFPYEGRYVSLSGNQRYEALKAKKIKKAPCKVIPADTPVETLNRYIVKINAHYGEWDWDMLGNEWEAPELNSWGVNVSQDWTNPEIEPEQSEAISFDENVLKNANERNVIDGFEDILGKFSATFLLPNEIKEQFEKYCKDNGKDELSALITDKIKQYAQ